MKSTLPKISIIIPLYVISYRFFADFKRLENLDYSNFEVLVVCDQEVELPSLIGVETKLILTDKKNTGPAEKRDLALKSAKGEICAFIDDDAYPDSKWLTNAAKWFNNPDVVAVGGPGLTPPEDSFWERVGGSVLESYLCTGGIQNRYYVRHGALPSFVLDWPAYNLLARTAILKKVGGYGSTFYGGEDTLLCLKMIKYGRIIFDPNIIAYHHRRSFPLKHLKQIRGVGTHRGYFFKKYPETSRSLFYLLPSFLTVGLILGIVLAFVDFLRSGVLLITLLGALWLIGAWSIKRHNHNVVISLIGGFGIIVTHITYGIYFVKGLLTKKLLR